MAALTAVGLAYLVGSLHIFVTKNRNFYSLAKVEQTIAVALSDCHSPCTIDVSRASLTKNLKYDWILPDFAQPVYLEWLKQKYTPEKVVNFVLTDLQNTPIDER